jgi:hypothetical protein
MIDTELSSVQGEDAEYGGGEGNSQATKPPTQAGAIIIN